MKFTRARDLATAGLLVAVLSYLIVRVAYGSLPQFPELAGLTLLILAVVDTVLGFNLRARIKHPDPARPIRPLTAARTIALAKASSLLGAIMFGAWLGLFGYVFPLRTELTAAANDMPSGIVGMLCAAALIAAGLWLEHCCRTPDDRQQGSDSDR